MLCYVALESWSEIDGNATDEWLSHPRPPKNLYLLLLRANHSKVKRRGQTPTDMAASSEPLPHGSRVSCCQGFLAIHHGKKQKRSTRREWLSCFSKKRLVLDFNLQMGTSLVAYMEHGLRPRPGTQGEQSTSEDPCLAGARRKKIDPLNDAVAIYNGHGCARTGRNGCSACAACAVRGCLVSTVASSCGKAGPRCRRFLEKTVCHGFPVPCLVHRLPSPRRRKFPSLENFSKAGRRVSNI